MRHRSFNPCIYVHSCRRRALLCALEHHSPDDADAMRIARAYARALHSFPEFSDARARESAGRRAVRASGVRRQAEVIPPHLGRSRRPACCRDELRNVAERVWVRSWVRLVFGGRDRGQGRSPK